MEGSGVGFALRYSVFSPSEVKECAELIDRFGKPYRVFIPDGRIGYEAIEMVSNILGRTKHVHAGSGVIRLSEHEPALLARRLQTLQAYSSNRCFLGIGTGTPGPSPVMTIDSMLGRLASLRSSFKQSSRGEEFPSVWVAALRHRIAKRVMKDVDGLLLNFCTPQHVSRLFRGLGSNRPEGLQIGCYLKLFYSSKSDDVARRLLVQEFLNYDSIPHYHEMFLSDGTAEALVQFRESNEWRDNSLNLPSELLRVSLANPDDSGLRRYVESFRQAGLDLPVIYPYFPEDEDRSFKIETIKRSLESVG